MITRDNRRETTRDCRGHEQRSLSGQLISCVVSREKRVSEYPLQPYSTRRREKTVSAREIEVKEKMEEKTRWRGRNDVRKKEKKSGRLDGAAEISEEVAEWRRIQWKNLSILDRSKRKEWSQCHRASS